MKKIELVINFCYCLMLVLRQVIKLPIILVEVIFHKEYAAARYFELLLSVYEKIYDIALKSGHAKLFLGVTDLNEAVDNYMTLYDATIEVKGYC